MHGYTVAFWVAAGVFAFGAVVVAVTMQSIKVRRRAGGRAGARPLARRHVRTSPRRARCGDDGGGTRDPARPWAPRRRRGDARLAARPAAPAHRGRAARARARGDRARPAGRRAVDVRDAARRRPRRGRAGARRPVDAYVPLADWGVRRRAFDAPLELRAEIRSIQREAVLRAATGEGEIIEDTRAALDDVAADALMRGGAVRARRRGVVGLIGALAWPRPGAPAARPGRRRGRHRGHRGPRHRRQRAGRAGDVRPRGVQDPSFYARGAELLSCWRPRTRPRRAPSATRRPPRTGCARSASCSPGRRRPGRRLHRRRRGRRRARSSRRTCTTTRSRSARSRRSASGDEPVFFVGDFGHQGSEGEARLVAPRLADLGPRVIAVSGNHDSALLMRRLARAGVTVLTGCGRLRGDGTHHRRPDHRGRWG